MLWRVAAPSFGVGSRVLPVAKYLYSALCFGALSMAYGVNSVIVHHYIFAQVAATGSVQKARESATLSRHVLSNSCEGSIVNFDRVGRGVKGPTQAP